MNLLVYCAILLEVDKVFFGGTEEALADQFVDRGVPKQNIVIADHAPNLRQYAESAIDEPLVTAEFGNQEENHPLFRPPLIPYRSIARMGILW